MNATALKPPPVSIYASWTPATDTTELPSIRCGDVQPTIELHLLDLAPAVPPAVPRAGLGHLRAAARSALTTAGVLGSGGLALGFVLVTYRLGELAYALSTGVTP